MENIAKEKNTNKTIIAVLCVVLLASLGFICYDKLLKKEEKECPKTECKCEKCEECNNTTTACNCSCDIILGEKISSFKEIKLTEENQIVRIGKSQYKIRIKEDEILNKHLFVNDYDITNNDDEVKHAYLTDKYIFCTNEAQFGEYINYAFSEKRGLVTVNDNGYSTNNFKMSNGYLYAKGGISDTGSADDYEEVNLIIKFIDNTLIVVPSK